MNTHHRTGQALRALAPQGLAPAGFEAAPMACIQVAAAVPEAPMG